MLSYCVREGVYSNVQCTGAVLRFHFMIVLPFDPVPVLDLVDLVSWRATAFLL